MAVEPGIGPPFLLYAHGMVRFVRCKLLVVILDLDFVTYIYKYHIFRSYIYKYHIYLSYIYHIFIIYLSYMYHICIIYLSYIHIFIIYYIYIYILL